MKYCKINLCVKEIHIHPNEGSQFLQGKSEITAETSDKLQG